MTVDRFSDATVPGTKRNDMHVAFESCDVSNSCIAPTCTHARYKYSDK